MNMRLGSRLELIVVACVAALAAGALVPVRAAADPKEFTVDEVLDQMNKKSVSITDLRATAQVTKFDSVFEENYQSRLELAYKKHDLTRVDTYKKRDGKEVHSQELILGKDFVLRVWPENRHGELRHMAPEEMKRMRENRNDPITFFSRTPEDLKKDFDVKLLPSAKPGTVKLALAPRNEPAPVDNKTPLAPKNFDYKSVELVVDTATWMPTTVKTMTGGETDDWSLYEFDKVVVNGGIDDATFTAPKDITVEEVDKNAPVPKDDEK
jgi:outer membrane lipoprotein-sorting protein